MASISPNRSYRKKFITQLFQELVISCLDEEETHEFANVVGMIVSLKSYEKRTVYEVDDGTGVIRVTAFKNTDEDDVHDSEGARIYEALYQEHFGEPDFQPDVLQRLLKSSQPSNNSSIPANLNIGSIVSIFGKVKSFRGLPQVTVHYMNEVLDPNEETQHILQVLFCHQLKREQSQK